MSARAEQTRAIRMKMSIAVNAAMPNLSGNNLFTADATKLRSVAHDFL